MEVLEFIQDWVARHPFVITLGKYLIWIALIFLAINFLRRFVQKSFPNSDAKYKSQKGIEVVGYILVILLSITYFTGNIQDFGLAIGLFTAGITITLQELILSVAGSFYILIVRVYAPGDRIQINDIKGDVIDIDSVYTTLMEIGEWVSSDNYTGRIVKLSNAFVFRGPVYNYSQDFPFIWDEFNIPIRYGSDVELAKSIIIKVAQEALSEYVKQSKNRWTKVVNRYYIENADINPTLAISLTDNWIQFNLRYIVDYKKRRTTHHILNEKLNEAIANTNGKVVLASATFEIVKIPSIDVQSSTNNDEVVE